VSIGLKGRQTYASGAASFWELVNNTPSSIGMDSRLVAANDQVRLEWYTPAQPGVVKGIGGKIQSLKSRR
jgi:hypothetical protein